LVKINAVSVNPVDAKLRMGKPPEGDEWRDFENAKKVLP